MGIIIILLFFAAAWFLLIVPRQRELRRHQALLARIGAGDEVVTSSGLYGTIRSIEGEVVQLEVAPGLELKVAKRAIATLASPPEPVIETDQVIETGSGSDPESIESGSASFVDLTDEDGEPTGEAADDSPNGRDGHDGGSA